MINFGIIRSMSSARLMVSASGHDADMLYATRFYADDPFIWWEVRGKSHIALSPLEIDRAKPVAKGQVHATGEFVAPQAKDHSTAGVVAGIAAKGKIKSFVVPAQFPAGLLETLRRKGLKMTVSDRPFFPERVAQDEGRSGRADRRAARGRNGIAPRHRRAEGEQGRQARLRSNVERRSPHLRAAARGDGCGGIACRWFARKYHRRGRAAGLRSA